MRRTRTRILMLFAILTAFIIAVAILYSVGMARFEGKPRTFLQSFAWAIETITTTGFGYDDHWTHPLMVALVAFVQVVGVFLPPLLVALYFVPVLSQRFEERVPRTAGDELRDHVVVYHYGPAVETLLARLHAGRVRTLVVESDERSARAVLDAGEAVVFSRSEEGLIDAAAVGRARAVVANGRDEENAALILRARQSGFAGEMYAFVEDPSHRRPLELAGATAVYTPRHIVAAALAAHASDRISPRLPGLEAVGAVERREIRLGGDCPIAGRTVAEAALPAAIVGQWNRSRLESRCGPGTLIQRGAVLELVGDDEALAQSERIIGARLLRNSGPFLIAGFGEVGRKVHELLCDAGETVRVVERNASPGVDVAGDVLDPSVLEKAGIREARALILALDSDDATLFATVIAHDLCDDIAILARVNHGANVENIHRAGAHYALSIADVSGEMLSSRLLRRVTRVREERRRVVWLAGVPGAGRPIGDLTLLRADGDGVWVCGTEEAISEASRAH